MKKKKLTNDDIANAIINMSENLSICDKETAKGLKTSKKKNILQSKKEGSFSRLINEIKKQQNKKD